jgi:hypothetical protein
MMLAYKTRAELKLEHLESLKRPLTDQESDDLRRSLHAVYCRNRAMRLEREANAGALAKHEQSEAETLDRVLREARL